MGLKRKPPAPRKGPKLEPHQVIIKPMVTEKGVYQSNELNQYTFKVNALATKTEIKAAVEELFKVKVEKVATQTRKGKPRRYRFTWGRTKAWKKAIVKLNSEHRIDFF
ncbi:50S ribosomal protein L23 [Mariniblastus fucicola]|uniref:Large ribosomal subunit protein uL23 n=1 Tax=Mariniblastus fucicola TaxID=980251 RepID=A0A5B9PEU3_9BACT|nr:50S ribosomal protein L23 [Mariniblastus fucicola]QEG21423.1 50S ribosomal protein L23 [Mariniblastus fucicola]